MRNASAHGEGTTMPKKKETVKPNSTGMPQARTLPRWDELPDFELYMDQMLSLMERYLGAPSIAGEKGVTASMVNNYVKIGLLPAPQKKRYSRVHLACLIVICALKPVLPLAVIQAIMTDGLDQGTPDAFYDQFCERFEAAECQAVEGVVVGDSSFAVQAASVTAALSAQAHRHVALSLYEG